MLKGLVGVIKGQGDLRKKIGHLKMENAIVLERLEQVEAAIKQMDMRYTKSYIKLEKLEDTHEQSFQRLSTRITNLAGRPSFPEKIGKSFRNFFRVLRKR